MSALEVLLSNRFVIKAENKERYYRIKDSLEEVRKFATEKLGCQLIANSLLIKLEKIPAKPENYMGITEFTEPLEYAFLCVILMFLEDKEVQEQFVLSQLTEYITATMKTEKIEWTVYTNRRHLIKVLRFCMGNGILKVNDGDDDVFATDILGEVLYENTGISKYFMQNFSKDIMSYSTPKDFETEIWLDVDQDRGAVRRQRVYKKLLMSPGMYRENEYDEDFEYLKRYGGRINDDLEKQFDCSLQLHRSSAFLILGPEAKLGKAFPEKNSLNDIILLCNRLFVNKIQEKEIEVWADESARISILQFERLLVECKERFGSGFVKTYREKTTTEFVKIISEYMEQIAFVEKDSIRGEVLIRPIVGKVIGVFPKEFAEGSE